MSVCQLWLVVCLFDFYFSEWGAFTIYNYFNYTEKKIITNNLVRLHCYFSNKTTLWLLNLTWLLKLLLEFQNLRKRVAKIWVQLKSTVYAVWHSYWNIAFRWKKKGSAINFGIYTFYPNIIVKKVTDFTRCTVSLHCDEIWIPSMQFPVKAQNLCNFFFRKSECEN